MANDPSISKILVNSNIETVRFDYEVALNKFTSRTESFVTKEFAPPGNQESFLYLNLFPQNNDFSVLLYSKSSKTLKGKTTSWLLTKNGDIWKNQEIEFSLNKDQSVQIYTESRSTIIEENNGLLIENILTFYCEFTLELESISEKTTIARPIRKLDEKVLIIEDLERLFKSGDFSDFKFTIGKRKFPVHKAILHSRSPYFKAIFSQGFEENTTNSVPIKEIEADLFAELLEYMYTSKIPEFTNEAKTIEVLVFADKYQLDSLKTICENELSEKMTTESMFNLLMVADTYNASILKKKTIEFISSKATSKDILQALFENKVFGSKQSKTMMNVMRDLLKEVK